MTLLIKNGHVLDGSGKPAARADIFVKGDRISAIGNFPNKHAAHVIDAQGLFVAPGFIDVHTEGDSDLSLLRAPQTEDLLLSGITSALGGHRGVSLAPLLYGNLEPLREWADTRGVNVHWHTFKEFLKTLKTRPTGINFGSLAGYATIAEAITGDLHRALTKSEIAVLSNILRSAMEEGAFGISLESGNATPLAMRAMLDILKYSRTVLGITLKKDLSLASSTIKDLEKFGNGSGIKIMLSGIWSSRGTASDILQAMRELSHTKSNIRFDLPASGQLPLPLISFLPEWAREGTASDILLRLEDEWSGKKVEKEFSPMNPETTAILQCQRFPAFAGMSIAQWMATHGIEDPSTALRKLMVLTKLSCVVAKESSPEIFDAAFSSPRSLYGSFGMPSAFRDAAIASLKTNAQALPGMIKKFTKDAADFLNIKERGVLKDGMYADIVIFGEEGMRFTLTNGVRAVEDGMCTGVRKGRSLMHGSIF